MLIGIRGWRENDWMKNTVRIVKQVVKKRWSWRTYIISWPIFGMYSTWMQLERKHYWGIQKDVRVTNLNLTRKQLFGLVMWRVMRRNVWEDIANWQIKKLSCSTRVSTPCLGDHQLKKEELETVGEFSNFCSHIVLKCLYVDRIVRFDMLWSVNKLCTYCHAMDQNLWPTLALISYIFITRVITDTIAMWVIRHRIVPRLRFCWRLWRF